MILKRFYERSCHRVIPTNVMSVFLPLVTGVVNTSPHISKILSLEDGISSVPV
jgi:hypothetical protein